MGWSGGSGAGGQRRAALDEERAMREAEVEAALEAERAPAPARRVTGNLKPEIRASGANSVYDESLSMICSS
jgi:hypothetical protein